jgi:hypothetical protein
MVNTAKSRQRDSISTKKAGRTPVNANRNANLVKYSDVLGLSAKEWNERMVRTRAIKTALQMNLLQAAIDADLEGLLTEAIQQRDIEKADLLERICRIVGATFREQGGQPGVQVNVSSGGDPSKPLSIKFTDAQEVKENPEVKEN